MSRAVRVRVQKYLEGETLDRGALVEIRALGGERGGPRLERVAVPIGDDPDRFRTVQLEPGRYEFSAYLPSGDVTSRVLEIPAEGAAPPVVLEVEPSAHEWQSWQHLFGNLAGRQAAPALRASFTRSAAPVRESFAGFAARLWRAPGPGDGPEAVALRLDQALAGLAPGRPAPADGLFAAGAASRPIGLDQDPPYAVVRVDRGSPADGSRTYLTVEDDRGRGYLCALPCPWLQADRGDEALVEAVVAIDEETLERTADEDGPSWSVRPAVRDRQLGPVLSYFSAGDAGAARELLEPAEEALFAKLVNPLAAAGGGYVLVGEWLRTSAAARQPPRWLDWIENLDRWFRWLPDGAILRGWLELRRRDREPDRDRARAALLEGQRRGLPYYTVGARHLADGLLLLAGDAQRRGQADAALTDAVARARRLSWQVDPRPTFTCVRLWAA